MSSTMILTKVNQPRIPLQTERSKKTNNFEAFSKI